MDREGIAYVQDLFCVLVAMVSISLLLVDLASVFVSYQQQSEQRRLAGEAARICQDFLGYGPVLYKGERGTFDAARLDAAGVEGIAANLRIEAGFYLRVEEIRDGSNLGARSWAWSTGPPGANRGSCVASASVHEGTGVLPARIVSWTWRV